MGFAIRNPDSLTALYGPTFGGPSAHCPTCTAWDSSRASRDEIQYHDLVPNQQYLFVVTAFDDQGAFDPIFDRNRNMLRFFVSDSPALGPLITMFNETFHFGYVTGGFINDPSRILDIEVVAGRKVTVNWFATRRLAAASRAIAGASTWRTPIVLTDGAVAACATPRRP